MMTVHNAKGLEFPMVFIAGLEDGLFPLARAFDEPAMLEEERRLFYVGITRAERTLYLSFAEERRRNGELAARQASRSFSVRFRAAWSSSVRPCRSGPPDASPIRTEAVGPPSGPPIRRGLRCVARGRR